jgi:hypothetical protein
MTEITIKYKGGSDYQQKLMDGAIFVMLKAFIDFYSKTHKKNEIIIKGLNEAT